MTVSLKTILLVALALRLAWALAVPVEPVSDSYAYDTFARNIVEHGTFGWEPDQPGAYWAVGAAAATAATYAVLGDTYWGVVILNIAASLGAIAFAERLGARYFGPTAGLAAAAAMAIWPNLIAFVTILSSELYFIFFTLGGLWFWERSRDGAGWRSRAVWANLLVAGLFWAGACYMRPIILLFPVALVISALPGGARPTLAALGRAAVTITVILALVAPWSMRNARVFGEPVMMSTNFGANFWMGNNPDTRGTYMRLPDWVQGMSEIERSDALKDAAMEYIRDEPGAFVMRTFRKAALMHSWETIGVAWNEPALEGRYGSFVLTPLKLALTGYWFLVLALGLAGLAVLLGRIGWRALFHPAFAGWSYFTAVHAVVVAGDRYHMPLTPFVALFAGLAVAWLLDRYGRQPDALPAEIRT